MPSTLIRDIARRLAGAMISGIAAVAIATPASAAPSDCAYKGYGSYVDGLALDHRDWEVDLANAINAYRAQNGLPALQYSRTLARPTLWASLDSHARGSSPPDHVDTRNMGVPQRVQFCSGYTGYVGEINYWGWGRPGATVEAAMNFWKNSPGHNRWLLDRQSTVFAVGMAYEGVNIDRAHYTVVFGDH